MSSSATKNKISLIALIVAALAAVIVVVRGQDLVEIPSDLSFSCADRPYGYYADAQTNCQVFHICLGGGDVKWTFLCPNQTIFNQQYFVCDYAINVDCVAAESYYYLNDNFGLKTAAAATGEGDEDGGDV